MKAKWNIKSRFNSFKNAFNGIRLMFKGNINFLIQCAIAIIVITLSFILNLSSSEWTIVLILIAAVLAAEIFNTAIENLSDFIHKDYHPKIKTVKDISAAAVLVLSIISAVIGLIIFIPKVF